LTQIAADMPRLQVYIKKYILAYQAFNANEGLRKKHEGWHVSTADDSKRR